MSGTSMFCLGTMTLPCDPTASLPGVGLLAPDDLHHVGGEGGIAVLVEPPSTPPPCPMRGSVSSWAPLLDGARAVRCDVRSAAASRQRAIAAPSRRPSHPERSSIPRNSSIAGGRRAHVPFASEPRPQY